MTELDERRKQRSAAAMAEYERLTGELDAAFEAGRYEQARTLGVQARDAARAYAATLPEDERRARFGDAP